MPDMWMDVDVALAEVPINKVALTDDTDFKTREDALTYDQAGLDLVWNFVTSAGAYTQTAVTPTTGGGDYDWTNQANGMYSIGLPASAGASANNDTEGYGWFTGFATGVLPWTGPVIGFRAAALNDAMCDGGDLLDVSVTQLGGVAQSATDLKHFADSGYDPATTKVQGVVLVDTATDLTNARGKYANGAVWIGPTANTNTVPYVDGIITNPVSTIAAAKTIADALKLRRFYTIRTGTTQIGADMVGYDFDGNEWSCTTTGGSRDVSSSHFVNAAVVGGTFASTSAESHWDACEFSDGVSVAAAHMKGCTFTGTLTLNAAGNYDFLDCASVVAGTGAPVFAVPAGTVNISFRRWSGGISITGITAATTISIDVVSGGTVTLAGADGNVQVRGLVAGITDSRTGTPTLGQNAAVNITKINTEADTALTDYAPATAAVWTATKAGYLTGAVALEATLTTMKGATFSGTTDSLEAIRDRGDAAWVTATGFALATVCTEGRLAELDAANLPADIDAIKAKTDLGLLNTTWTDAKAAFLDAAISGVGGAVGSGADAVTLELLEDDAVTPIADADVWVSTDAAGANVVAGTLQTNSLGKATFMLDAGVLYYRWCQKDGIEFTNPSSFTAVAD